VFAQLTSWDNLLLAYRRAAKGKRGHANVAVFEHHLEENLISLQDDLRSMTYRPGPYDSFFIHEPKRRLISAAPFRDRVIHHALCNVIESRFERGFVAESYANRVGKGTHRALEHCQRLARRYPFVLQADVRQYFPSVDHAVLRETLARRIPDDRVMWLVDRILASGVNVLSEVSEPVYFPGDDLMASLRPRGLPIGNLTSQFWANVYLDPFDHFVKRELGCPGYVRYVDDLLLFGDSKPVLWAWRDAVEARLARLRLTIHPGAHPRPVTEGIPFLGFVIWPDHKRLKARKVVHYRRRLARMVQGLTSGQVTQADVTTSIAGWVNHARFGNTVALRRAVLGDTCLPSAAGLRRATKT